MLPLVKIVRSAKAEKKYDAHFLTDKGREKVVSFGSAGMDDFTKTKDKAQQQRYIARHARNENWSSPMTAGALSRYGRRRRCRAGLPITRRGLVYDF